MRASPLTALLSALEGISFLHHDRILSPTLLVRRVCPGRYTADGSLWAAMVSILAVFKITKAVNERGEEVDFEPTFSHGVTLSVVSPGMPTALGFTSF